MNIPYFFIEPGAGHEGLVPLNEEHTRHALQVLRLRAGDPVVLTDGLGSRMQARIAEVHKKTCLVRISHTERIPLPSAQLAIGISLLKQSARFEWFLEKATELGIREIVPLRCQRTERQQFRMDRLRALLVSAMLQSRQCWLPILREPREVDAYLAAQPEGTLKLIAHCEAGTRKPILSFNPGGYTQCLILIGPEGDFTPEEIQQALGHGFHPVTLGTTRLRTETAGVTAAVLLTQLFAGPGA